MDELNMAKDVEWIEGTFELKNKRGAWRFIGYTGLIIYAVLRIVVIAVVFAIALPIIWIKEKMI